MVTGVARLLRQGRWIPTVTLSAHCCQTPGSSATRLSATRLSVTRLSATRLEPRVLPATATPGQPLTPPLTRRIMTLSPLAARAVVDGGDVGAMPHHRRPQTSTATAPCSVDSTSSSCEGAPLQRLPPVFRRRVMRPCLRLPARRQGVVPAWGLRHPQAAAAALNWTNVTLHRVVRLAAEVEKMSRGRWCVHPYCPRRPPSVGTLWALTLTTLLERVRTAPQWMCAAVLSVLATCAAVATGRATLSLPVRRRWWSCRPLRRPRCRCLQTPQCRYARTSRGWYLFSEPVCMDHRTSRML